MSFGMVIEKSFRFRALVNMRSFFVISHFVLLLVQIQGQRLSKNKCPSRPILQNFDVSKYIGKWYEIYRYEQPFTIGCSCVHASYTARFNRSDIGVRNCCVRGSTPTCIYGTAVLSYPDHEPWEALLNVTFFGPPKPSNYWILDTDYNNYSIVYRCENLLMGHSKDSFWLLSRAKVLSSDVIEKVDALVDKYFSRKDSVFIVANQSETCSNEL